MSMMLRRLRPIAIVVVALLFTSGIALAAKPTSVPKGLDVAAEAAGKTVPVRAEEDEDEDQEVDEEEAPEAPDAPDADEDSDGGDHCATDPTGLTAEELAAMNHGAVVCWAAHQETPEGFDNHGAWVSSWAKQNHGHADEATGAAAAKAHSQGKPKSK